MFEPEHAPGGVVDVLQAAELVHHEHAFDHAREDRDHARAIALELVDAPSERVHGAVQRTRYRAELVVSVVGQRPLQIADRVPPRHFEDGRHAPLDRARERGRDEERRDERAAETDGGDHQQLSAMRVGQAVRRGHHDEEQRESRGSEHAGEDAETEVGTHG